MNKSIFVATLLALGLSLAMITTSQVFAQTQSTNGGSANGGAGGSANGADASGVPNTVVIGGAGGVGGAGGAGGVGGNGGTCFTQNCSHNGANHNGAPGINHNG